ncbi:MAG: hypothetical protein RLY31_2934 [Bacteroidota bacterium]|jgi:hypothetical protein
MKFQQVRNERASISDTQEFSWQARACAMEILPVWILTRRRRRRCRRSPVRSWPVCTDNRLSRDVRAARTSNGELYCAKSVALEIRYLFAGTVCLEGGAWRKWQWRHEKSAHPDDGRREREEWGIGRCARGASAACHQTPEPIQTGPRQVYPTIGFVTLT